jgi:hypothetical protein
MQVTLLFVFLTVAGLATGRDINLINNLDDTILVEIKEHNINGQPENREIVLVSGQNVSKGFLSFGYGT